MSDWRSTSPLELSDHQVQQSSKSPYLREPSKISAAETFNSLPATIKNCKKITFFQVEVRVHRRKSLEKSNDLPSFSGANNISLPKFSGAANEDMKKFIAQFKRAAEFYKFSEERKAQILPLLLTGHANLCLNSRPLLTGTTFDTLSKALKKQVHTERDL